MNSNLFSAAERKVGATRQAGGYGPGIAIDAPAAPVTDAH
ncbi:hypothetical protein GA0004736_1019 [Curtobacterium sp. 9128]|nr:hypothetical protein GA0004736_1019 [Curtobacterium sp. 9128]